MNRWLALALEPDGDTPQQKGQEPAKRVKSHINKGLEGDESTPARTCINLQKGGRASDGRLFAGSCSFLQQGHPTSEAPIKQGDEGFLQVSTLFAGGDKESVSSEHMQAPTEFPHGTAFNGEPKTWTGKIVSLDEWRRLSEWDRHGSTALMYCGACRGWKKDCEHIKSAKGQDQ